MQEDCCNPKDRGFLKGVLYGILPHTFCIGLVIFSAVGAVSLTAVFKEIMLIPYFIQIMVALSIIMATFSAIVYLKRNECLCGSGIKRKWKYLTILYGLTIFINFSMFSYVLPALANMNSSNVNLGQTASLSIAVEIPCSGHAPLIMDELKKDIGVKNVIFKNPSTFDISYDPTQTSPDRIKSMEIFKTYKFKGQNY